MTFGEDWGWGASPVYCERMLDLFADAGAMSSTPPDLYTNGALGNHPRRLLKGGGDRFVLAPCSTTQTDPGVEHSATTAEDSHLVGGEAGVTPDRPYRPYWVHAVDSSPARSVACPG